MLYMEKQRGKTKCQIWTLPKYGQILTTPTLKRTHQTYYTDYCTMLQQKINTYSQ